MLRQIASCRNWKKWFSFMLHKCPQKYMYIRFLFGFSFIQKYVCLFEAIRCKICFWKVIRCNAITPFLQPRHMIVAEADVFQEIDNTRTQQSRPPAQRRRGGRQTRTHWQPHRPRNHALSIYILYWKKSYYIPILQIIATSYPIWSPRRLSEMYEQFANYRVRLFL